MSHDDDDDHARFEYSFRRVPGLQRLDVLEVQNRAVVQLSKRRRDFLPVHEVLLSSVFLRRPASGGALLRRADGFF